MVWPHFDGKPYNRDALATHIASLDFSKWRRKDGSIGKPSFITLHNTSSPTIALWLSWSPAKHQQYIFNVQKYYETELRPPWRGGPHFFVPPDSDICAFGFNDPMSAGTHASCFNNNSIGIEMVGEFDREAFDSGPGALVRDNAVHLMALLHKQASLVPEPYVYGKSGIHFHVECRHDNHDCPGKAVHKPDIVARVWAQMAALGAPALVPAAEPLPPPPTIPPRPVVFHVEGRMSTMGGPDDTGFKVDEGLALFATPEQMVQHLGADFLLSEAKAGAPGLGRRLNPSQPYLACRWPRGLYPMLRDAVAWVENAKTGARMAARPVDWGPNERTGRVADLSPGLAQHLALKTDDLCAVTVYADGK